MVQMLCKSPQFVDFLRSLKPYDLKEKTLSSMKLGWIFMEISLFLHCNTIIIKLSETVAAVGEGEGKEEAFSRKHAQSNAYLKLMETDLLRLIAKGKMRHTTCHTYFGLISSWQEYVKKKKKKPDFNWNWEICASDSAETWTCKPVHYNFKVAGFIQLSIRTFKTFVIGQFTALQCNTSFVS